MSERKTCRLGDVISLVIDHRGLTPLKLGGDWAKSGYRAISAKSLKTRRIINEESIRFVDVDMYRRWMREEIHRGDILVTSEAPFGEVYFWDSDEKIVLSQRIFGLRPKEGICASYLFQYMTSSAFQGEMAARATGTTVMGLRQPELLKCSVSIPDLPTQRRIAAVLGALDDKIELNRKMNANLEAMAQALFKSWFVDFEPFGGKMPKGWRRGVLSDVAEFSPRRVSVAEARGDYFSTDGMKPNRQGAEASSLPEVGSVVSVDVGDVLVSNIRPYFKKIFRAVEPCMCSTDVLCFKPKVKDYGLYLYRTLWSDEFFAYAVAGSKGTKMPRGDKSQMMAYEIPIPNEQMLLKFNSLVDPLCGRIDANTAQSRTLAQLRDALLPKLMSGEVNVDNVKI